MSTGLKGFISYRHVKPDKELTIFLHDYLEQHEHEVFIDRQLVVGTQWRDEIEQKIREADFFIVLLSKESIRSDMVRQEVHLAQEVASGREPSKPLRVLPIRIAFEGELPNDLGLYLDQFQYELWREGETFDRISEKIRGAIEKSDTLTNPGRTDRESFSDAKVQKLFNDTEAIGAPLPAADPRLVPQLEANTGAVKLDSRFYVVRDADAFVLQQIQERGSTTVVNGSRQMGKSSLLARAQSSAKRNGQKASYLDFQLIDSQYLESLESLLRYLARSFARAFKTSLKPDDYWDASIGAKDNLTYFLEDTILHNADTPILILLDEADRVFNYPYCNEFFATLRAWHNRRATEESWNNLNLVIAHSTEPYLLILDMNQSPFNVGKHIKLEDFDLAQIFTLNDKHGTPLKTQSELQDLIHLVGGQPYLVRQALYTLVLNKWSMSQLRKMATEVNGPFGDHLQRIMWSLRSHKELQDAVRQTLRRGICDDESHFQRLRAAGLVKGETRNVVKIRCKLYEEYFRRHL